MGHVSRGHVLVIQLSLLGAVAPIAWAQSACDLNKDGAVDVVDVQLATNMYLGLTPCTATINGPAVCNQVVVQRVTTAATGGGCVVDHYVSLGWTASTTPNVSYNVYRRAKTTDPYAKVGSTAVGVTSYVDMTVQTGQTYYYAATSVDSSNRESVYSDVATATVP